MINSISEYDNIGVKTPLYKSKEFDEMRPAIKFTYGFIYRKNKKYLWTFNTYDEKEDEFTDRNVFPMGVVLNIEKIEI